MLRTTRRTTRSLRGESRRIRLPSFVLRPLCLRLVPQAPPPPDGSFQRLPDGEPLHGEGGAGRPDEPVAASDAGAAVGGGGDPRRRPGGVGTAGSDALWA